MALCGIWTMAQEVVSLLRQPPVVDHKLIPVSLAPTVERVYDTRYPRMLWIPDTMAKWPYPRGMNRYYEEVKAETREWCRSFNAFNARSQYAFEKCDFTLLAACAFPHASKEHLRNGSDLMILYYVIDEYTDVEDKEVVKEMLDIVKDALLHPHKLRPKGENLLGELTRQYYELATQSSTPSSQRHFLKYFFSYLDSVVDQAEERENDKKHTIDSYMALRRENSGIYSSWFPAEATLDIRDEIYYHPAILYLADQAADLITLDNDICSFNREQATDAAQHNIITVAMDQLGPSYDGVMRWVVQYHAEIEERWAEGIRNLPSFGPQMDKQVAELIRIFGDWPRGMWTWAHEGGRYFGDKGFDVLKTRQVPLLWKKPRDPSLKKEHVDIQVVEYEDN